MATAHLLLEVVIAGRTLRVADDAIDVYDAASATWHAYSPGIDGLTVSSALDFLAVGGNPSVPVEAALPVDVAALDALGHRLAGCAATISLWTDGDDYAARQILATGVVVDPEWGEDDEPVAFSVSRPASTDTALAIPSAQRVDGETWPDFITAIDATDLGIAYPRVYGRPGWVSASSWVTGSQLAWFAYGTPGAAGSRPPVGADFVAVIAGHRVNQSYVMINHDDDPVGLQFAVYHTRDGRGCEVAVISKWANYPTNTLNTVVDGAGQTIYGIMFGPTPAAPDPIVGAPVATFVGWTSPLSADTGGLSPIAGDVIMDQIQQSGSTIDYGRFAAALPLLAGYRFDCVIDDPKVKALEWLRANIYPVLPLSMVTGPDGDYPIVWRYDATTSDATARIDADSDPMVSRAGKAKSDAGKVANAFSLQYRYSVRTGSYTETITRDATTCPYCAESERRNGRIESALTTVVVYDAATAAAILGWMARAYTSPTVRVPYLVPSSYRLTRGQVVTLTDSRMSYDGRLCLVADVQVDGSGIDGVEFLFIG